MTDLGKEHSWIIRKPVSTSNSLNLTVLIYAAVFQQIVICPVSRQERASVTPDLWKFENLRCRCIDVLHIEYDSWRSVDNVRNVCIKAGHVVKEFLAFTKSKVPLSCSLQPAVGPYSESEQSVPNRNAISLRYVLILSFHLHLGFTSDFLSFSCCVWVFVCEN
jgi:hypothetical protein